MIVTHVCLVSGQALPNLIPLLDPAFAVEQAVLVVSNTQMKAGASALERVLTTHGRTVQIEDLGNDCDFMVMRQRFRELSSRYSRALLNVTGGKKTMTLAAFEAFNQGSHAIYYIEQNNAVQWLRDEGPSKLNDCLGLNDIAEAHGFSISDSRQELPAPYRRLAEFLFEDYQTNHPHKVAELVHLLQFQGRGIKERKVGWCNEREPKLAWQRNGLKRLMERCLSCHLGRKDLHGAWWVDARMGAFLRGAWFEIFLRQRVESLSHRYPIRDLRQGMVFSVGGIEKDIGPENEFDVVFVNRNQLFLIECKAHRNRGIDINPFIYKLDSIKSRFGGLTVHAALVLLVGEITAGLQEKADQRRIRILTASNISQLEADLETWILEK